VAFIERAAFLGYSGPVEIKIGPGKIARVMTLIVASLLLLNVAGLVSRFFLGYDSKLISAFSFGYEQNFPTFYSALALLFCAALLAIVGAARRKAHREYAFHWGALAAIFAFLSADEMLEIHEVLIVPVREALHTGGMLRFAWVIPYGVLVAVFVLAYLKFLRDLPAKTRRRFVVAGALYVLGALGMELLGSKYYDLHGGDNFVYVMHQTLEELLEMAGVIVFAHAIAEYLRDEVGLVQVNFK
jgi:hypothetical protein